MLDDLSGMPEPGDVVAERYRLGPIIGTGAAGVVFDATHEVIGRRVALKWLYPQMAANEIVKQRFLREARAACTIDHPNVVEVYDAGQDRDSLYIVMEKLYGEPFSDYIERGVKDPRELIDTIMPALCGVAAAHKCSVVHRDLKPDNIFLAKSRRGRPGGAKVLDFGISKLRDPQAQMQLTTAGTFIGSPHYMAPEQIADSSTVDERADVYSIGVMLYEALTGKPPHDADSLSELFFKITTKKPKSIAAFRKDLPKGLEAVIMKAMNGKPAARYPDIPSLARQLQRFARSERFSELPDEVDEEDADPVSFDLPVGDVAEIETAPTQVANELEIEGAPTQISAEGDIDGLPTHVGVGGSALRGAGPVDRTSRPTDPTPGRASDTDPSRVTPAPDTDPSRRTPVDSGTRHLDGGPSMAALHGGITPMTESPTNPLIEVDEDDDRPTTDPPESNTTDPKLPPPPMMAMGRPIESKAGALSRARTLEIDGTPEDDRSRTVEMGHSPFADQWEADLARAREAKSQGGFDIPSWAMLAGAGLLIALIGVLIVVALF